MAVFALTASAGPFESVAMTNRDCGANAVFVLLHLEGRPVTLAELERALPPRRTDGYSMAELADATGTLGLGLDGVRFGKADKALTRPAIAFLRPANDDLSVPIPWEVYSGAEFPGRSSLIKKVEGV
jgi:hypothetical protein